MIIYMNLCKTKGILGSWKQWFSYINEKKNQNQKSKIKNQNQNFGSFAANFWIWAEGKKVTSRAELKILQLELWLEPARLGLISSSMQVNWQKQKKKCFCLNCFLIKLSYELQIPKWHEKKKVTMQRCLFEILIKITIFQLYVYWYIS